MLKRFLLSTGICVSALCITTAQTNNDFLSIKNFTPPSPESAAMARYGDIPVDLSVGIAQVSVPLYEIKSRQLSFPLSLSYHASGIKVEDIATPVGLGWVLNAGGSVSRTVVGWADEKPTGCLQLDNFRSRASLVNVQVGGLETPYLKNLSDGTYDTQSDIYNFNIPSVNGKFVYDTNLAIQHLPVDRQLKIIRTGTNMFSITDDNGVYFEFNEPEKTERHNSADTTTWHLTRMISADRKDTISFEYVSATQFVDFNTGYTFYIQVPLDMTEYEGGCNRPPLQVNYDLVTSKNWFTYDRKLIDKIKFANGYVKFEYLSDREDPVAERLYKIRVYNNDDELINLMTLSHGYFVSNTPYTPDTTFSKRLKLNKVEFAGRDSIAQYSYKFDHNTTTDMPAYRWGAEASAICLDNWGYANGQYGISNETLLPEGMDNTINGFVTSHYPSANSSLLSQYNAWAIDRGINTNNTQAFMLERIHYPTGGYSAFEFENNKKADNGNNNDFTGGLRIKKITTYDSISNVTTTKRFTYSTGIPRTWVIPYDFHFQKRAEYNITTTNIYCGSATLYITANPIVPISYYNGSAVFYETVTEQFDTTNLNIGKTVYTFEFDTDSIYASPNTTKYWNFSTDKSWARGNLLNQKTFKKDGANYVMVKEIRNDYESMGQKAVKVGQVCELMTEMQGGIDIETYMNLALTTGTIPYSDSYLLTHYEYEDVFIPFGSKKLIRTEEIDYLNDTITKKKEFIYCGTNHLYTKKIYDYGSLSGDTLITIMKYPQDKADISGLSSPASVALDSMISKNIRATVVESDNYRNATLLTRDRTDFVNYSSSDRYYPQYLNRKVKSNSIEQRIEYTGYDDRGNVTTLKKLNDHSISYIWDYKAALPVAQVSNADNASIAFTSFEADGKGGWTYSGSTSGTYSLTGSKSYQISGGNITKTGLTSTAYIVSYWGRSGSVSVNSAGPTRTGKTVGDWTYYEHEITTTSITVSGSNYIDELRLYPKGALMTSFTHNPMIGVTTQCDAQNRISYYEYDVMNRLKLVKDQDKNIIKVIDYKYMQSQNQ